MSKKKDLTRKVLCGLLAATTIGISGTALAGDETETITSGSIIIDKDWTVSKDTTYGGTVTVKKGNTLSVVQGEQGAAPRLDANDITMKGGTINAQSGTTNISSFKTTTDTTTTTKGNVITVENASLNIGKVKGVANFKTLSTSGTGSLVVNGNVTAANITADGADSTTSATGIIIDKNVTVNARTLTSGTINASGDVVVSGAGLLESTGTITAGNITFNAANVTNSVNNLTADSTDGTIGVGAGKVTATGKLAAKNLNVNSGAQLTAKTVEVSDIDAGGKLTVTDTVKAASLDVTDSDADVTLTNGAEITGDINVKNGKLTANGAVNATTVGLTSGALNVNSTVNATTINVTGGTLTAKGLVTANSINAGSDVELNGGATVNDTLKVTGGTFTAGGTVKAGTLTINNNVENKLANLEASTINVNSGAVKADDITLTKGTVAVAHSGSLEAAKMNVKDNSTVIGTATVNGTLSIDEGKVLSVGTHDKAGQITVNKLSGGVVFLDPAWSSDGTDTIEKASGLAMANTDVTSTLVAGENSKIAIGTNNLSDADDAFNETGFTWGETGVTAGVYIFCSGCF